MEQSEPMTLEEVKEVASTLNVPVTRYLTDIYVEKYGISELPSIRACFDAFHDAQQLISRGYIKSMPEPLAFDITRDVIERFSFKTSPMPDIFKL